MTDKQGIVRLTRVAQVRGSRLERAAEAAQIARDAAVVAFEIAKDSLTRQEQRVIDARTMFADDPACPQAKLWLEHSICQMGIRAEATIEAEGDVKTAEVARTEAVRSVARHQARSDRIAAHHAQLRRADRRHAETLAELDAPVRTVAR